MIKTTFDKLILPVIKTGIAHCVTTSSNLNRKLKEFRDKGRRRA